jgi:hypothetical protein
MLPWPPTASRPEKKLAIPDGPRTKIGSSLFRKKCS